MKVNRKSRVKFLEYIRKNLTFDQVFLLFFNNALCIDPVFARICWVHIDCDFSAVYWGKDAFITC